MTAEIDVFWSFRSPYSYLAIPDIHALARDFDVLVRFRPVYPLAIRRPDLFTPARRQAAAYIALDSRRRAQFLCRPFARPDPDPVIVEFETQTVAAEQPYIHWLTALGIESARQWRGLAYASEVSAMIFGGLRGWNTEDNMSAAAARAGLDHAAMRAAIDGGDQLDEARANAEALQAAGHWGVPTFVYRGEPFFGQDRVETLRWRLDGDGLSQHDLD